jgi:hypothetical protein
VEGSPLWLSLLPSSYDDATLMLWNDEHSLLYLTKKELSVIVDKERQQWTYEEPKKFVFGYFSNGRISSVNQFKQMIMSTRYLSKHFIELI